MFTAPDARHRKQSDQASPKHKQLIEKAPKGRDGLSDAATSGILEIVTPQGTVLDRTYSSQVGSYNFQFSCWTHNGVSSRGLPKENQDSWVIRRNLGGLNNLFFAVYDGHGSQGRAVSSAVAARVTQLVEQSPLLQRRAYDACLYTAFPEANAQMRAVATINSDLSGSTGVAALIAEDKVTVANLGDSRCILGRVTGSKATAFRLTNDHTPELQLEAKRIIDSGGRIATFMNGSEPIGPPRVWLRDTNLPGLCMTRSFGDNMGASVGVIDKPEVVSYELDAADRYLIVMSDGIFEFIENQQIMDMVHAWAINGVSPAEASQRLVQGARKRWSEEEDGVIDDCTAMVVYLQHKSVLRGLQQEGLDTQPTRAANSDQDLTGSAAMRRLNSAGPGNLR